MKKLFLLIAVLAIFAAAHFAKPQDPKQSFTDYIGGKAAQGTGNGLPVEWTAPIAQQFADQCTFPDHLFWVDAKFQDKTVYTNVFGHWYNRAEVKKDFQNDVEKAKDKMDHAADKIAGK